MRIIIKRNDIGILFRDTLKIDDVPVDLSEAAVRFLMKGRDSGVTFSAVADVSSEPGEVSYTSAEGFPTTVDVYRQEWQVTILGAVLTFPSDSYNEIQIIEDLG